MISKEEFEKGKIFGGEDLSFSPNTTQIIKDALKTNKNNKNYCVYVIRCHKQNIDEIKESCEWNCFLKSDGSLPSWVYKAYKESQYKELFYIGTTSDLDNRLQTHIYGEEEAARFTKIFNVELLMYVLWTSTRQEAEELERFVGNYLSYLIGREVFTYYA